MTLLHHTSGTEPTGGATAPSSGLDGSPSDPESRWYACYTRARHEKKVDARLRSAGFDVFLPTVPRERAWHDRTTVVEWPLFPSYLFARFRLGQMERVVRTPGIATIVRFGPDPAPVPESEIENVRRLAKALAESGGGAEPEPLVEIGERVRVTRGPFEGIGGVVVEHRGGGRVLLAGSETIGQGVRIEVDAASLQALGESS